MNKIGTISLALILLVTQGLSQDRITVFTNNKEVGRLLDSNEAIGALEFTFPERIHHFQLDTLYSEIFVQLRGLKKSGWPSNKGQVVRYSTDQNKVLWSKKVSYNVESIEQFGGITLHTTGGKSYCLNNSTGEQLWEAKNSLLLANPEDHIGIGYQKQVRKGSENTLEGIDLVTGRAIWQREISREYSWNDIFYLDDSTILFGAAGLHTLNINDGTGWDYHAITGDKDYTAAAVGTGLGIAAGLLTGTYTVASGHSIIREVNSNIIIDSLHIYFASKEHIVKLDKEGKVQWKKPLPPELVSKSRISKFGDEIIMVNMGYAYMGYRRLNYGKPFIASFNQDTGERNYLVTVTNGTKEIIRTLYQDDSELLLVFDDRISKHSLDNGLQILNKEFDKKNGGLAYFIGEQVFTQQDSLFLSLPKRDTTKYYLYSLRGDALILDNDLNITGTVGSDEFYINYLVKNDLNFIARENQTYVVNQNGVVIAEFSATNNSIFLNNKLYDAQERSFREIDLTKILEE